MLGFIGYSKILCIVLTYSSSHLISQDLIKKDKVIIYIS